MLWTQSWPLHACVVCEVSYQLHRLFKVRNISVFMNCDRERGWKTTLREATAAIRVEELNNACFSYNCCSRSGFEPKSAERE
jgi:hypothetical protein